LNFIVDAQLPTRLCAWRRERGHDCVHTKNLPTANRTTDSEILRLAAKEKRCVISKDGDFRISFELGRGPERLLLISTGNLPNDDLLAIFSPHELRLFGALEKFYFVELHREMLVIHA
jgi:predicted nuclease of predicted toxin-antitoxin system